MRPDPDVLKKLGNFLNAINERELLKQQGRGYSYVPGEMFSQEEKLALDPEIMYWHPNRSHHDEVIWLNNHVFRDVVPFRDQVLNSAVVKFYGPSTAVEVAVGQKGGYIDFGRFSEDKDYRELLCHNLDNSKESIWGKTELRTSLQTASRNYMRGIEGYPDRKFKPSDILSWVASFEGEGLIRFYESQPSIETSYRELTKRKGIGSYYGYHFTCNLSRNSRLRMNENEDFCVPGPGACQTLRKLFPKSSSERDLLKQILFLKENQEDLFRYDPRWLPALEHNPLNKDPDSYRLTTFGIEIASCQMSVFDRFVNNPSLISKRKIIDPRLLSEKTSSGLHWGREFFS